MRLHGETTPRLRRLWVVLLGALVATSVVANIGVAEAAPFELYPGGLVAGDAVFADTSFEYTSVNCAGGGTGTFSFEAEGRSESPPSNPGTAPYPGTFEETGTAAMVGGQLTAFHADFTIHSVNGEVTGTKDLVANLNDEGFCDVGAPEDGRVAVNATVAYTATTPNGVDTGCAHVTIDNIHGGYFFALQPDPTGAMLEQFENTCPIQQATVTGTVTDQNGVPFPAGTAGAAACPGPTASPTCPGLIAAFANGAGSYTLNLPPGQWTIGGFAFVNGQLLVSNTVTVTLTAGETRVLNFTIFVPTPLAGGGSFVIGDQSSAVGSSVTYWGSQWAKKNSLSGGSAPSSFKGFANTSSNPPACGQGWTTRPGNSSNPPASVPQYMAVVVTSSASKSGSTISGNTTRVVVVRTNPGYDDNPGHAGTGTVVAVLCQS